MKNEMERGHYMLRDASEQPHGPMVLFVRDGAVLNAYQVDRVEDQKYCLVGYLGDRVVTRFSPTLPWQLIDSSYLELVNYRQVSELAIEAVTEKVKAGARYARAENQAIEEERRYGGQPPSVQQEKLPSPLDADIFQDFMKRLWGSELPPEDDDPKKGQVQ